MSTCSEAEARGLTGKRGRQPYEAHKITGTWRRRGDYIYHVDLYELPDAYGASPDDACCIAQLARARVRHRASIRKQRARLA
jgi:hypothetical protein